MPLRTALNDDEVSPEALEVFNDIRETRQTDYVNNFWRVLAHDPAELRRTWNELKTVMGPGDLDPVTKELIYIAVSITNGCEYCIHSHTAAGRAKGMSETQYSELLSIVAMAAKTNQLATALQVPVDEILST